MMARSFAKAVSLAASHENLWYVAKGPAMVVLASLKRIGWVARTPFVWITREGTVIDLDTIAAADVGVLAKHSVRDWLWYRAAGRRAAYQDFKDVAPYTQPLITLLRSADTQEWGPAEKGMLCSIVADSWWGSGACELCMGEWSTWHGIWQCPAMSPFARQYNLPDAICRCAQEGPMVPLFSTCLVVDLVVDFPGPLLVEDMVWSSTASGDFCFGAEAFGDGSGINIKHYRTRRCGFAVVGVDRHRASRFLGVTACGALPGPLQEVPVAELMALMFFLRHSLPNSEGALWFYTDCEWVVATFARGEAYATHPMRRFAGVWKALFKILDDVLPDRLCLNIVKVKAHASVISCDGDEELLFLKRGNDEADAKAKEGAARHPSNEADLIRLKRCNLVQPVVAKYVARLGVWRRNRYGRDVVPARPPSCRVRHKSSLAVELCIPSDPSTSTPQGHRICSDPFSLRLRCVRCMASAENALTLAKQQCIPQSLLGNHKIWRIDGIIFCRDCGAYSERRTLKLGGRCLGFPSSTSAEQRRLRMLNGVHPTNKLPIGMPRPDRFWDTWLGNVQESDVVQEPISQPVAPLLSERLPEDQGRTSLDANG